MLFLETYRFHYLGLTFLTFHQKGETLVGTHGLACLVIDFYIYLPNNQHTNSLRQTYSDKLWRIIKFV
jgi:hypothetical protein